METLVTLGVFLVLLVLIAVPYWIKTHRHRKEAVKSLTKSESAGIAEPVTLHPRIDLLTCIGCASCVRACPEDVLGIVDGRAVIVNGLRCIGHAICADVCPVGAITMGFGKPREGMEIPLYDEDFQTNVRGLYIVGELGGIGLIRNAFTQGIKAVEHIASTMPHPEPGAFDIAIIGAGPAGIGAALAAKANNLRHIALEQYDFGGSILHYPRKKLVLTQPIDLPLYGRLKVSEISKEELLELFAKLVQDYSLNIATQKSVQSITRGEKTFRIQTAGETYEASRVILALGRRGSPKKLGVPGEELSKVYYRLIEAESYSGNNLLVVGGGDSAIEAAVGLARQRGNTVTLSYRREAFMRLKAKNEERIAAMMKSGAIKVIFNSGVTEIRPSEVIIKEGGNVIHRVPNDFTFIFAGGELPTEFLKKAGVELRKEEQTAKVA